MITNRRMDPDARPARDGGEPTPISRWPIAIIALLVVGAVSMVAFSLNRPNPPEFAVTPQAVPDTAQPGSLRLTVDASSPDHWRFVSLEAGAPVHAAETWDLAFQRFHVIANGGSGFPGAAGILDLGAVPFDAAHVPEGAAFVTTAVDGDSTNPAIARWYRYGFTSHLLTPLDRTYVVRGADGKRLYAVRVVSYYCPGARPGCVTIRYRPLGTPDP